MTEFTDEQQFSITTVPIRITFPTGEWAEISLRNCMGHPSWEVRYNDGKVVRAVDRAVPIRLAFESPRDLLGALMRALSELLFAGDIARGDQEPPCISIDGHVYRYGLCLKCEHRQYAGAPWPGP